MSDRPEAAYIEFKIGGKPRGQGRAKATAIGKLARVYRAKADRVNEMHVRQAFLAAVAGTGFRPITGPVILRVVGLYLPPKSIRKADRLRIETVTGNAYFDVLGCSEDDLRRHVTEIIDKIRSLGMPARLTDGPAHEYKGCAECGRVNALQRIIDQLRERT